MKTIEWRKNKLRIIDQTRLPTGFVYLDLEHLQQVWWAIKKLKVRGAPAIGIAAAFGVVLGMRNTRARGFSQFKKRLDHVTGYLRRSRPTAVNLFWALERMEQKAAEHATSTIAGLKKVLLKEAIEIMREDMCTCRQMAGFGAKLIKNKDTILTHCNAGSLATADYGTALGVLYQAKNEGRKFKVYADETRPLLQGARLTTWELMRGKIDVTLICDNMAAHLMEYGLIDKVIVGADRIAANGDAANKIGTYSLAVLAKFHRIPFYIVAPGSTFDFCLKSGKDIPIEQRDPEEVRRVFGRQVAPRKVKVYNPAFDVTPHQLITAIVTEKGIFKKPYRTSLRVLQ